MMMYNKKILCSLIFAIASFSFVFAQTDENSEEERIKIGFAEFENKAIAVQKNSYGRNGYTEIKFDLNAFVDQLQTALVMTRRFEVIERTRLDAVLTEQGLGLEGIVNKEQTAEMGQIKGLNFILMGTVTKCGFSEKPVKIRNFEQTVKTLELGVDFRLVDVHMGKNVLADFVEVNEESASSMKTGSYESSASNENFIPNAMRKASLQAAFLIANAIIPLKVDAISDKKVKLNYGRGFLEKDQVYKVFPAQDESGWDVGFDEVARIQIKSVTPKFAVGEVIEGDADMVSEGCACYKLTPDEEKEYIAKDKVKKNENLGKRFGY